MGNEDEYFSREDALKLQKLAKKTAEELQAEEREKLKAMHWMHCPKCGFEMREVVLRGVTVDKCFHCHYIGLDDGELEQLAGKEHNILKSLVATFRKGE